MGAIAMHHAKWAVTLLGGQENGGKTIRELGAWWPKFFGAGGLGTTLDSRRKSREQGLEETNIIRAQKILEGAGSCIT